MDAAAGAVRGAKKAQGFGRPEAGRATMVGKLEILFAPELCGLKSLTCPVGILIRLNDEACTGGGEARKCG